VYYVNDQPCTNSGHNKNMNKNKNLTETEIRKISKKLGWSLNDTKNAIDELRKSKFIINQDELLRICINSNEAYSRIREVGKYIASSLEGETVESIKNLYSTFNIYLVIRIFHQSDFINKKAINLKYFLDKKLYENIELSKKRSFFHPLMIYKILHLDIINEIETIKINIINSVTDVSKIKFLIIDEYIKSKLKLISESDDERFELLNQITVELINELGFGVFEFPILRMRIVNLYKQIHIRKEIKNEFKNISVAFYDYNTNTQLLTAKKNKFYYCLIQKIIEKENIKVQTACKLAQKPTGEGYKTLRARYYDKNKIVNRIKDFDLDEFIQKQGFTDDIDEYLDKVVSVK